MPYRIFGTALFEVYSRSRLSIVFGYRRFASPPPASMLRYSAPLIAKSLLWIGLGCLPAVGPNSVSAKESGAELEFNRDVLPILRAHCFECHGQETQEGGLQLDGLSQNVTGDQAVAEVWHEVLNAVSAGKMPPDESSVMTVGETRMLTDWVSAKVNEAIDAQRRTDGRVVLRKLNRQQYQNTLRDLLGVDMDYVRDLPPDAVSLDGFTNDGRSLRMSAFQLECYLDTARKVMERVLEFGEAPQVFKHEFAESRNDKWISKAVKSNRLGRQQEFLAKMKDYPDSGEFLVRVKLSAELLPNIGFPLLEVSVGYCPDTQILVKEFELVEVSQSEEQIFEFRGRLEDFPLPVRGQGKYPGLVVRVRNVYDDGSKLPQEQKDEKKQKFYPDEQNLPKLLIQSVSFEGPIFDQWPPATHREILFESLLQDDNEAAYVKEVLTRFMTRAFRRPVELDELQRFIEHYDSIRPDFPSQSEALQETLALVLIQPEFLYLMEPASDERRSINGWEMASRLSYFLWSTMPDEKLLKLAASGELLEDGILAAEVDRMLSDSRASRFVEQFTNQWLQLERLESVAVDPKRYPKVDEQLKQALRLETQTFFSTILADNLSALQFLDSDFVMLNERLARHYGVPNVVGNGMRPVKHLPEHHRGGLLGQGSILLGNSTGSDSHPIRRAVWIRDRLLNDPPAPPPPDVPSLEEADPKFRERSIREQLEIHRKKAACANCHQNLDPWGIALENYDAVGLWREGSEPAQDGQEIPAQAVNRLPGGIELTSVESLKRHLLEQRTDDFSRSLVVHMLTYALGRPVQLTDRDTVSDLTSAFKADNYQLRDLITHLVLSAPFKTK